MLRDQILPQSEVIRAILLEGSLCLTRFRAQLQEELVCERADKGRPVGVFALRLHRDLKFIADISKARIGAMFCVCLGLERSWRRQHCQ